MNDVLIVDDDDSLLQLLELRLQHMGFQPRLAGDGPRALAMMREQRPAAVITDLRMEPMDGLTLLDEIQQHWPGLPVIMLTAHGSIPDAIAATQKGGFAFLTKPVDTGELKQTLQHALSADTEANPTEAMQSYVKTRNPVMLQLIEHAQAVARSDINILINGASGTGKELLAKAIHHTSYRREQPFVAVNCAAISPELLESELFGHKKGAFTGAHRDHKGLFETASGGTLFLDEIGDMPLSLQAKILRVLQEREVRPVGSNQHVDIDVRVISATHRDLQEAQASGEFRQDLYYRLNVANLTLPALKERRDDIPLLVNLLLNKVAKRTGQPARRMADDAMQRLTAYDWPGNVRELENVVEQSVALAPGGVIPAAVVDKALPGTSTKLPSLSEAKQAFEKQYVEQLLKLTEGNVAEAAKLADRNRSDFYKILKRHQIDAEQFKSATP